MTITVNKLDSLKKVFVKKLHKISVFEFYWPYFEMKEKNHQVNDRECDVIIEQTLINKLIFIRMVTRRIRQVTVQSVSHGPVEKIVEPSWK